MIGARGSHCVRKTKRNQKSNSNATDLEQVRNAYAGCRFSSEHILEKFVQVILDLSHRSESFEAVLIL